MMLFALLASAFAGQWLPADAIELSSKAPTPVIQKAGRGVLLLSNQPGGEIQVVSNGIQIPLKSGPEQSQLVSPAPRTRTLLIQGAPASRIEIWHETDKGEAAAWDRYESRLRTWFATGGVLPVPPRSIAAIETDWQARREAFLAHFGRARAPLLMGLAQLELQRHRSRSKPSHASESLQEGRLRAGKDWSLQVEGPGVLEVQTRAEMNGKVHRRFVVSASSGDQPVFRAALSTVENPDHPGLGHLREFSIPIPRGSHTLSLQVDGADLRLSAKQERLRSPTRAALEGWTRSHRPSDDPVLEMERAHLSWDSQTAVDRAKALLALYPDLAHPVHQLARARIIEHSRDSSEALRNWQNGPIGGVGATALLRRWTLRQDVSLNTLVEAADQLPADPEWLAAIADALPAGFIRPRGHAIRQLAQLSTGADTHSRWTALHPDTPLPTLHLVGTRGGIGRVLIRSGQKARVRLPSLGNGRYPLLRLSTDTPTRYTINGDPREGSGELFEALDPGMYEIEVQRGALLLLDGSLAVGGQFMRERPLTSLPGSFAVPDPGVPAEVEVLISGGTGPVTVRSNTGETWSLSVEEGLNRFELHLGSWTERIDLDGPEGLRASVAMRRALEVDEPFASAEVLGDPLRMLHQASRGLHTTQDGEEKVALRLIRAAALEALGLLSSARKEARAAAETEHATPTQKRIAEVILRESQPLALSAEAAGPVTVAAAAAQDGIPYSPEADLQVLVEEISPVHAGPVHLEMARRALEEGQVAEAWMHAQESGPLGRVERLRIASSGHWEHITRVNASGGSSLSQHGRNAAGLGSSPLRLAREALLGAPWLPQDGLVLHDSRSVEVDLSRPGKVTLNLVCSDWAHQIEAPACEVPVTLNGETQTIALPSESFLAVDVGESTLERGLLRVGPLQSTNQALGLLVLLDEEISRPSSRLVQHRIGEGLRLRVKGESLLRVKTYGGATVVARGGGESTPIRGEGILPLPDSGWVNVHIAGDARSWVSLSRLVPQAQERVPTPLQRKTTLSGTTDSAAGRATARWISEVSLAARPAPFPVGRGGTFQASVLGGLDQSGQRDNRQDYPFGGGQIGWYQRLPDRTDWWSIRVASRGSDAGFPSVSGLADWVHMDERWASKLEFRAGYSGSATMVQALSHFRGLVDAGPNWLLQPWLGTQVGHWSEDIGDPVDPWVWNTYDLDHFWGVTAGLLADWRPYRDGRLRFAAHLRSSPDIRINWAESFARADWMMGQSSSVTLLGGIGHRFETAYRSQAYWRPRFLARVHSGLYLSHKLRVSITSDLQWLPLQQGLEGGLALHFQASPRRGVRDFSPLAFPFNAALDSRVEER
ncbi:MAG: hypothetical protein VXW32_14805 [Myxococcota bacterium]|nr:hypothetical protein [Myxococcota bacterium]